MLFKNYKFALVLALAIMFGFGYICSSSKDDKTDTKKEDTKKEDTKKEDTKTEPKGDTKSTDTKSDNGSEASLYFCEEYTGGKEIGKSDVFTIGRNGGYFTCMINLRGTGKKIGVGKLDLRITKKTGDGEKIVTTENFDVQPDWDYIYFDKFHTFYDPGRYKVTALKPDGTPVASGEVTIEMR